MASRRDPRARTWRFTWPGRWRLTVRLEQSVDHPRRDPPLRVMRKSLSAQLVAGTLTPERVGELYGRGLERYGLEGELRSHRPFVRAGLAVLRALR